MRKNQKGVKGMKKISGTNGEKKIITTQVFRVSYPKLSQPDELSGKYSITMLFEEKDKTLWKEIKSKMKAIKEDVASPVKTEEIGDTEYFSVSAKSKFKVPVFDNKGRRVNDEDVETLIYPGCYARAKVIVMAYEFMGKKGITLILKGIQFVRDGEPFVSASEVEFDPITFDDDDDEDELQPDNPLRDIDDKEYEEEEDDWDDEL